MSAEELVACSCTEWHPAFQHVTFRSRLLALPPGFADFIVRDGVFVSSSTNALPRRGKLDVHADEDDYHEWKEEAEEGGSEEDVDESPTAIPTEFKGFMRAIDAAIEELGGKVMPKLNWSAPKDAVWLKSSRNIDCSNADEVMLLLESSDRIAHDISEAYPACMCGGGSEKVESSGAGCCNSDGGAGSGFRADDHLGSRAAVKGGRPLPLTLVLRQWRALLPGREFRCFVAKKDLIGICQRDITQDFPGLADEKADLAEILLEFHEEHVQLSFPLADYTFDVYVTPKGTVRLLDFNPAGGTTSALLFDWAKLPYGLETAAATDSATEHALDFRIVSDPAGFRPTTAVYGMPFDLADQSAGGAIADLMRQTRLESDNDAAQER